MVLKTKIKTQCFILAVLIVCLSSCVTVKPYDGIKREDTVVGVFIYPQPVMSWCIQIKPDGMVMASYGSNPFHQIHMPVGTVKFNEILDQIRSHMTNVKINQGTQAGIVLRGESSHQSRYLTDDSFLRRIFVSDPKKWRYILPKLTKDTKPNGFHIEEISEEMVKILANHPIFPKRD